MRASFKINSSSCCLRVHFQTALCFAGCFISVFFFFFHLKEDSDSFYCLSRVKLGLSRSAGSSETPLLLNLTCSCVQQGQSTAGGRRGETPLYICLKVRNIKNGEGHEKCMSLMWGLAYISHQMALCLLANALKMYPAF